MRFRRGLFSFIFLTILLALLSGCRYSPPVYPTGEPKEKTRATARKLLQPSFRGRLFKHHRLETEGSVGGDYDVDVSPDGTLLVFSSTRHNPEPKIMVKNLSGSGLTQKTHGPQRDIQPKFSPDGQWIAYASDRSGSFDVLIISARRNEAYWQLTHTPGDEIHPTWSPDGKRLAYCAREGDGNWSLWIIEFEGQRRTQLGPGVYPEWSPDGQYLAFQRPSLRGQGWYGIWIVEVTGGAPREVASSESWGCIQPCWSPNSSRIAYSTARSNPDHSFEPTRADDLWVVEIDGGPPYRLTTDPAEDYAPAWGLDGRIYFTSDRGGTPRIWSAEPERQPDAFRTDSRKFPGEDR